MEVKRDEQHPSSKLGPVEYILYTKRYTDSGNTIIDAISAEDYEQIYPVLMCCSFPMNTFESFHKGLFTGDDRSKYAVDGELSFLQTKIRSMTNDRIHLLPISRTLYELFYLKQYLYARVETDFATESVDEYFNKQLNMLLIRPFFFDHNSKLTRITLGEFCDQARAFVLDDPYLCLLHYELNTRLVDFFKLHTTITDWSSITYNNLERVIDTLCNECEALQKGMGTDVAKQFDTWPLTSPALGTRLEQMYSDLNDDEFEQKEDELETLFLNEFVMDLKQVQRRIKAMLSNKTYRNEELIVLVDCVNKKAIDNELYGLLYNQFCAELSSYDLEALDGKVLNKMLNTINFVDKVDTCVDRFRKRGYINRELIKRCIQLEMEPQQEDVCFLYRATNSINEEGNTIKDELTPHSLSFGPSLFAGAMHDKTATVYNYLIQEKYAQGYLIKLPKKEMLDGLGSSLFFMPPLPAVVQLAGIGELFHPRSKVFIEEAQMESREHFVSGVLNCSYARVPKFLTTTHDAASRLQEVIQANRIIIK